MATDLEAVEWGITYVPSSGSPSMHYEFKDESTDVLAAALVKAWQAEPEVGIERFIGALITQLLLGLKAYTTIELADGTLEDMGFVGTLNAKRFCIDVIARAANLPVVVEDGHVAS